LLLHALPVMVALFVLFPRLPGPLWAIPGSSFCCWIGIARALCVGLDQSMLALKPQCHVAAPGHSPL
jgi:hypothetical protein